MSSQSNPKDNHNKRDKKEKYTGKWNGENVSFTRSWSTHRFTDEECERLLAGEEIVISGLKRPNGKTYSVKGKLERQNYDGHEFVGFKSSGYVKDKNKSNEDHKGANKWNTTRKRSNDNNKGAGRGADKPLGFSYGSAAAGVPDVSTRQSRRSGLESQCLDMGVDKSELEPETFRFTGSNSGGKVKRAVGAVAKGTAVAAGVGVLGVMAGTTALAAKGNSLKDELVVSFGESMSYYIARLLGGNDHMGVQRFQQAGMKGVEMVTGEKTIRKVARPLPTINMPVVPDNDLSY